MRNLLTISRAIAACVGIFFLVNLAVSLKNPSFDANYTWMGCNTAAFAPLLWPTAVILLWAAISPPGMLWRRALTAGVCGAWGVFLFIVGLGWYLDLFAGRIRTVLPLPVAWVSAASMIIASVAFIRTPPEGHKKGSVVFKVLRGLVAIGIVAESFILSQLYLAGSIKHLPDKADCIVVLGSAVRPDGTPSPALYDRTRTGCLLYLQGKASELIMSGGVTNGVSEPKVMARIASEFRIPAGHVIVDEGGSSTYESARSLATIMEQRDWFERPAIVVSHEYHLSRTALAFRRKGIETATYPAERTRLYIGYTLGSTFRESFAWVYYWLRPIWDPV